MEVFLVLTHYMGVTQDAGAFSSHNEAEAHIEKHEIGGKPEIMKTHVIGELTEENSVFTASWYDHASDTHIFEGVYGNYEHAKQAAGDRGLVLNRKL